MRSSNLHGVVRILHFAQVELADADVVEHLDVLVRGLGEGRV